MSETWITLTDAEVLGASTKERVSIVAIKTRDDLAEIVKQVTEQVRDAYRNGGRILGADGMIPSGLRQRAIAMALWLFITSGVPRNDGIHTKEREKAYTDAVDYLNKIAMREIKVAGSAQIVSQTTRVATRAKLSGL